MTTTQVHETRRRTSPRLAIDPYRVEDIAWTRDEILAARGYPTTCATATRPRPRRRTVRPHR